METKELTSDERNQLIAWALDDFAKTCKVGKRYEASKLVQELANEFHDKINGREVSELIDDLSVM